VNILQLHWYPPNPANPAGNLAGARIGWISEKWLGSVFAGVGVEIWYKPSISSSIYAAQYCLPLLYADCIHWSFVA